MFLMIMSQQQVSIRTVADTLPQALTNELDTLFQQFLQLGPSSKILTR